MSDFLQFVGLLACLIAGGVFLVGAVFGFMNDVAITALCKRVDALEDKKK